VSHPFKLWLSATSPLGAGFFFFFFFNFFLKKNLLERLNCIICIFTSIFDLFDGKVNKCLEFRMSLNSSLNSIVLRTRVSQNDKKLGGPDLFFFSCLLCTIFSLSYIRMRTFLHVSDHF
jgi:hypothetical protein